MRTHELADQAGVNPQTLRYYERRGLLPQPPRSPSGYRDYPNEATRVIRFIKRAQHLGFTLDQIDELLDLAVGGPNSSDTTRTLAEHHIADLTAKIADLHRMRDALHQLIATCTPARPRLPTTGRHPRRPRHGHRDHPATAQSGQTMSRLTDDHDQSNLSPSSAQPDGPPASAPTVSGIGTPTPTDHGPVARMGVA